MGDRAYLLNQSLSIKDIFYRYKKHVLKFDNGLKLCTSIILRINGNLLWRHHAIKTKIAKIVSDNMFCVDNDSISFSIYDRGDYFDLYSEYSKIIGSRKVCRINKNIDILQYLTNKE